MANFTTHIAAGTVVAGSLATLTLAADVVAPENLIAVTLAGVLGSVLPDIDLKDSRPGRAMFAGLAIFFSFALLFTFAMKYSIAELWIIWIGTLVFVRYGLHAIFHRLAVHRGIWHSVLAAVFSAATTAIFFFYVLGRPEGVAWLAAGFLFIGYIVHLALDELYSVDIMDTRVKASFGTALKLVDPRHPRASVAMAVATAIALWLTPSTQTFVEGISSRDLWAGLNRRLLPEDRWFGFFDVDRLMAMEPPPAAAPDGESPITTGTLPEAADQPQDAPAAMPAETPPVTP